MLWPSAVLLLTAQYVPADQTTAPSSIGAATPPRAISGSWMSDMNYPKQALLLKQEGVSVVQLRVNSEGKVDGCTVQQSSGSPSLDDATCMTARSRRFAPAKDPEGKAVAGETPMRMNWHLPSR